MKIEAQDIQEQIDRAKRYGLKIKKISNAELSNLVREANRNTHYIQNEGLWAFVMSRIEEGEKQ